MVTYFIKYRSWLPKLLWYILVIRLLFQFAEIESKLATLTAGLEATKLTTEATESTVEQKLRQSSNELKCIKTDLSSFNQVNKDFLQIVKVTYKMLFY